MEMRRNRTAGPAALAVATVALLFASLVPADASSRLCRDLEARLAGMGTTRADAPLARRYQKAIADQRAQIDKAESQRRRAGCSGFDVRGGAGNACHSLGQTLDRMHANLRKLEANHRQLGGQGETNPRRERQRVLASLDANGCRASPRTERRTAALFDEIPRGRSGSDEGGTHRRGSIEARNGEAINSRGTIIRIGPRFSGRFRTVCVRTCDGYFFPISYDTSGADLDRDAAACSAMCPGTSVELYLHRAATEETDKMVSRAGVPYTDLPAAFSYRKVGFSRPPGCECNAARNYAIIGGASPDPENAIPQPPAEPVIPTPLARPDPAADAETRADRQGGLDVAAIRNLLAHRPASAASDDDASEAEKRIRVVGPTFLPDPEAAIDLTAPGPHPVP